jgi:hypothetical protein
VQSLETVALSVQMLSCQHTDGHGNLISPQAGLKIELFSKLFGSDKNDFKFYEKLGFEYEPQSTKKSLFA